MEEKEKKRMFEGLYALDESSEGEYNDELEPSFAATKRDTVKTQAHNLDSAASEKPQRRASTPAVKGSSETSSETTKAPVPPSRSVSNKPLEPLSKTAPATSKPSIKSATKRDTKMTGKRKRGDTVTVVPENRQIFKGLSFFFFPNSDVDKTRKFRINKSLEYGAARATDWEADNVTHVIIDSWLNYGEILKFLKLDSLPKEVIVVNDNYIPECVGSRFLLNPDQYQFRVKGHKEALDAQSKQTVKIDAVTTPVEPVRPEAPEEIDPLESEGSDQPLPGNSSNVTDNRSPGSEGPPEPPSKFDMHPRDALTEAIEEARATKDLPIDSDNDHDAGKGSSFDVSDDDSEEEQRPKSRSRHIPGKSWQENFSCMSKHDGGDKEENLNARTIEVLQQMASYYDQVKDHWRTIAYRKVIAQLRKQDQKISTAAQAAQIPWIGSRLADKIEEIVVTNKLRRLESTKLEPNDASLKVFLQVYGAGFVQAQKWVDQGFHSLSDLQQKATLSENQIIGVEHFDDFNARIPRSEVQRHESFVRRFLSRIDATLEVTICGSYRRGAADSGDIDFIITKPEASITNVRTTMLDRIIPALGKAGYIKTALAATNRDEGSKWQGACALPLSRDDHTSQPFPWRRIDFLFVPWEEMGAALIYFTGNDIFNRSIRLLASKKGMRLNQKGLWKDVLRGPKRQRMTQGTLVESRDEKKIFELLSVPWREPWERIC